MRVAIIIIGERVNGYRCKLLDGVVGTFGNFLVFLIFLVK